MMSCLIYPIVASWVWGGGWLQNLGFIDDSGASAVYLIGSTVGFIGTLFLKPRIGEFNNFDQTKGLGVAI